MASKIGIKIANGEFYPLIEENSLVKKKMVLTTAHDNQSSVQIDLFRADENTVTDAQYIGSVVVENIKPKPKGEPSIEMVISSNSEGEIIADAIDLDSGSDSEHYVLTVSLKSLDETSRDVDISDFDLDSGNESPSGLYQHANKIRKNKSGRSFGLIFVLIGIVVLGLLAVWLFFFGGLNILSSMINRQGSVRIEQPLPANDNAASAVVQPVIESPPAAAVPSPVTPAVQAEPAAVVQSPDVPSAPRQQTLVINPSAPVFSYNVPSSIPREGVNYRIRYGDTLWDISQAFYSDPWQYQRIAQFNNINNPNNIISGRTIRIPPRAQ